MGTMVFFYHRDAGFDCQLLGLAKMLHPFARGQRIRSILTYRGPNSLRPLEVA